MAKCFHNRVACKTLQAGVAWRSRSTARKNNEDGMIAHCHGAADKAWPSASVATVRCFSDWIAVGYEHRPPGDASIPGSDTMRTVVQPPGAKAPQPGARRDERPARQPHRDHGGRRSSVRTALDSDPLAWLTGCGCPRLRAWCGSVRARPLDHTGTSKALETSRVLAIPVFSCHSPASPNCSESRRRTKSVTSRNYKQLL